MEILPPYFSLELQSTGELVELEVKYLRNCWLAVALRVGVGDTAFFKKMNIFIE